MTSLIMDSPALQSSSLNPSRLRAHSTFSQSSSHALANQRGAIHKRSAADSRSRSISASQADRLYSLAVEQSTHSLPSSVQWITPQSSPQLNAYTTQPPLDSFPQWTIPTPPRSDSGIPGVSADVHDEPVTTGLSAAQEFGDFGQPTASAEMSSLGYLLPSQYGSNPYDSESAGYSMDKQYIPSMQVTQPAASSGAAAYSQTVSSSPALYSSRTHDAAVSRRYSEMQNSSAASQAYDHSYRRISSPYDAGYSVAPNQTIPPISGISQSPLPSPHMGATPSQYSTSSTRSPSMYDPSMYQQQPYTTAPSANQMYASSQGYPSPFVGNVNDGGKGVGAESIRVLNQRPKPQCWEHGCNGRQFSTFSNLLRHQREKSGTATKSYCPKCGAEFTRTTARNGHLAHDKCTKQRRPSDDK